MTILPSPQASIQALIARLDAPQARTREAAVARLRLQGRAALRPLLAFLADASAEGRRSAVGVLEALEGEAEALRTLLALCADADPSIAARALEAALERAGDSPEAAAACVVMLAARGADAAADTGLRLAAIAGLLRLLGAGTVEALEPLLGLLLDESADDELRLAAAPVLVELEPSERQPLITRLAQSASAAVRARVRPASRKTGARDTPAPRPRVRGAEHAPSTTGGADLAEAVAALRRHGAEAVSSVATALTTADSLSDPAVAQAVDALAALGAPALPALQHALDDLSRARAGSGDASRAEGKAVLHLALARLDSRLALYDLRDMLAARPPRALPRLLAAAAQVGDGAVAAELVRLVAEAPTLRDACAPAFAAIVAREALTKRHRAWRTLRPEERPALGLLWPRG